MKVLDIKDPDCDLDFSALPNAAVCRNARAPDLVDQLRQRNRQSHQRLAAIRSKRSPKLAFAGGEARFFRHSDI